ncbi:MAG: D-alanyl-D-alanine carboxypeptidase family protein [bacterium]|nr:D-alanyl-D-alanine carboxypeptidase family protein [bacterium]
MKRRDVLVMSASILCGAPAIHTARSADSTVPIDELLGLSQPPLFDGKNYNLREPVAGAFAAMAADALKDGIKLYSYSSYRGFDHQLSIWNRKYDIYRKRMKNWREIVDAIVTWSSIPGTSRHHWGTDLDIIDAAPPRPAEPLSPHHFDDEDGVYHPLHLWLTENAHRYGFLLPYTNDPQRTGYHYEPWHWSFAELSIPYLRQWSEIDLHDYIATPRLKGYENLSASFFEDYKKKWGFGINAKLLPAG